MCEENEVRYIREDRRMVQFVFVGVAGVPGQPDDVAWVQSDGFFIAAVYEHQMVCRIGDEEWILSTVWRHD